MPANTQVAKTNPEQQQVASQQQQQQQRQNLKRTEEHEYEAKASASTGINLNIFTAVSGIFSGKSKKTSHTDANGETTSHEDRDERSRIKSKGHSTLNAVSTASSEQRERHKITDEMEDDESTARIEGQGAGPKEIDGAKK